MNIQYFKNAYESFQNTQSSDLPKVNAKLLLWLDANDPNNDKTKPNENSELNNWIDKSGSKKDAVATTPGKIVKNNTNSNMILRLDKNLNYFVKYPSFPKSAFTIFTVQRASDKADFARLIHAPAATDTAIFVGNKNGNVTTFTGTDNWNDFDENTPLLSNLNTWRLVTTVVNDKNLYPYVDGTPQNNKIGITKDFDDLLIGYYEDQSWVGDVGDILIFDQALSLQDRISIETFLSKKWDIKLTVISEEPTRIPFAELLNKSSVTFGDKQNDKEIPTGEDEWVYSEEKEKTSENGKSPQQEGSSKYIKRHRIVRKIIKKKAIKLEEFKNELFSNILNGLLNK